MYIYNFFIQCKKNLTITSENQVNQNQEKNVKTLTKYWD